MPPGTDSPRLLTTGCYGELRETILTDDTVEWVFMPALIAVIMHFHNQQESILSEKEVNAIRDKAAIIALPKGSKEHQAQARGYEDIHFPEYAWVEYLYHIGVLPADDTE